MRDQTELAVCEALQTYLAAAYEVNQLTTPGPGKFISAGARESVQRLARCKASILSIIDAIHRGDPNPAIVGFANAAQSQADQILDTLAKKNGESK